MDEAVDKGVDQSANESAANEGAPGGVRGPGTARAVALAAAAGLLLSTLMYWIQVEGVFLLPFRLPDALVLLPGFLLATLPALLAGGIAHRLAAVPLPHLTWAALALMAALITPPMAILAGSILSAVFEDTSSISLLVAAIAAYSVWAAAAGPVLRMLAGPGAPSKEEDGFVSTQGDNRPVIAFIAMLALAVATFFSWLPGALGIVMIGLPCVAAMIPLAAYATSRRPIPARSPGLLLSIWVIPAGTALLSALAVFAGALGAA